MISEQSFTPWSLRGPNSHKKNKCIWISSTRWQILAPKASRLRPPGQRLRAQLWFAKMINLWVLRMRNVYFLGLGKTAPKSNSDFKIKTSKNSSGRQLCGLTWSTAQSSSDGPSKGMISGLPRILLDSYSYLSTKVGCQLLCAIVATQLMSQ